MSPPSADPLAAPVVFAYDGSDLAKLAIADAGRQLAPGRSGLVLTVWQRFDVGFMPAAGARLDAEDSVAVKKVAEQTAEEGAALAQAAGFEARGVALEEAPTWKGIVSVA